MEANMKRLLLGALALTVAGCASYFQPPKSAREMWKPTARAGVDVDTALQRCHFIDRMSVGVERIHAQAKCMHDLGFKPDFSSYSPHNCYGDAPAGCIVYWPRGMAEPQLVQPQRVRSGN